MGMIGGSSDREFNIRETRVVDHSFPVRGERGGRDVDPRCLAVDWELRGWRYACLLFAAGRPFALGIPVKKENTF